MSSQTTSTAREAGPDLSTGAKIGIGVGAGVGGLALLALGFLLARLVHRRHMPTAPYSSPGEVHAAPEYQGIGTSNSVLGSLSPISTDPTDTGVQPAKHELSGDAAYR